MSDNPARHESRDDLWNNPMGTDGFEFVEYTGPDPAQLAALFEQMGFVAAARHRSKNVTLYKQGDVNFILNAEPESFAQAFARLHGLSSLSARLCCLRLLRLPRTYPRRQRRPALLRALL